MATTTPLSPRLPITTAGWLATFIFTSPFCFAQARAPPAQFTLANDAISATWSVRDNSLRWRSFKNGFTNSTLTSDAPVFELLPKEGSIPSYAERLGNDPGHDFADEVHSYFGTRTQLQEKYVTPALLSEQDSDVLAQSAKWSRTNAEVLKDSHWIGGDPAQLQVYGWASWSPGKSILTLRNPSDQPQEFTAKPADLLELPASSAKQFTARNPSGSEARMTISTAAPHIPFAPI